jgi:hypothetical protein
MWQMSSSNPKVLLSKMASSERISRLVNYICGCYDTLWRCEIFIVHDHAKRDCACSEITCLVYNLQLPLNPVKVQSQPMTLDRVIHSTSYLETNPICEFRAQKVHVGWCININYVIFKAKIYRQWRMLSSGIWFRVANLRTDVSAERIASVFRVKIFLKPSSSQRGCTSR